MPFPKRFKPYQATPFKNPYKPLKEEYVPPEEPEEKCSDDDMDEGDSVGSSGEEVDVDTTDDVIEEVGALREELEEFKNQFAAYEAWLKQSISTGICLHKQPLASSTTQQHTTVLVQPTSSVGQQESGTTLRTISRGVTSTDNSSVPKSSSADGKLKQRSARITESPPTQTTQTMSPQEQSNMEIPLLRKK